MPKTLFGIPVVVIVIAVLYYWLYVRKPSPDSVTVTVGDPSGIKRTSVDGTVTIEDYLSGYHDGSLAYQARKAEWYALHGV